MNAVIHLHLSPWGDFIVAPVDDPQRSDPIYAAARDARATPPCPAPGGAPPPPYPPRRAVRRAPRPVSRRHRWAERTAG